MNNIPSIVIEQELGNTIKIIGGLDPGAPGRYHVNLDGESLVVDENGVISTAYSVVFIDNENPADATIFSAHASPMAHRQVLKDKAFKLYRTPSGAAFVYDIDPDTEVGQYYQISQARIERWFATGQTNIINLPTAPVDERVTLHINGTLYPANCYTIDGSVLTWSGPFQVEPADEIEVFFY